MDHNFVLLGYTYLHATQCPVVNIIICCFPRIQAYCAETKCFAHWQHDHAPFWSSFELIHINLGKVRTVVLLVVVVLIWTMQYLKKTAFKGSNQGTRRLRIYNPQESQIAKFMGPIWGRQDPGGPHVGPLNFVIWDISVFTGANMHWSESSLPFAKYVRLTSLQFSACLVFCVKSIPWMST